MIKLGEKIKALRKGNNLSQEVFANYLGVSFQAVSKWETGNTMPDVTMIPAIASFFGVSTDELFDFNLFEIEKQGDFLDIFLKNSYVTDQRIYVSIAEEIPCQVPANRQKQRM